MHSIKTAATRRSAQTSLNAFRVLRVFTLALGLASFAAHAAPEVSDLKIGFIKLTDMAPLAVAREYGYFEEEGLNVELVAQPNWKALLDNVLSGELQGAQMLPGQALSTVLDDNPDTHLVTPMSLGLNGNAITLSNELWENVKSKLETTSGGKVVRPVSATALAELEQAEGLALTLGMVSPLSTHNYELRYWLAAGGVHPGYYGAANDAGTIDADVELIVVPPPQMPSRLESGEIDGYCVGEPWNQQAVADKIGVPVISDFDIWNNNPEKVLGLTQEFVDQNPETTLALIRALLRATFWLDQNDDINRGAAIALLARDEYVGASAAIMGASMTGTFEYEQGEVREEFDFNVFYRYFANYPFYSDAIWTLTQMRRWGQIAEHQSDDWYEATARSVYQPQIFMAAAQQLIDTGVLPSTDFPGSSDGYKAPDATFIDGIEFDARKPNAYLESLEIGLKQGSPTQ